MSKDDGVLSRNIYPYYQAPSAQNFEAKVRSERCVILRMLAQACNIMMENHDFEAIWTAQTLSQKTKTKNRHVINGGSLLYEAMGHTA